MAEAILCHVKVEWAVKRAAITATLGRGPKLKHLACHLQPVTIPNLVSGVSLKPIEHSMTANCVPLIVEDVSRFQFNLSFECCLAFVIVPAVHPPDTGRSELLAKLFVCLLVLWIGYVEAIAMYSCFHCISFCCWFCFCDTAHRNPSSRS